MSVDAIADNIREKEVEAGFKGAAMLKAMQLEAGSYWTFMVLLCIFSEEMRAHYNLENSGMMDSVDLSENSQCRR